MQRRAEEQPPHDFVISHHAKQFGNCVSEPVHPCKAYESVVSAFRQVDVGVDYFLQQFHILLLNLDKAVASDSRNDWPDLVG